MTITVTNIVAGPYTATGAEQSLAFPFKVFTPEEIEVVTGTDRTPVDPSLYTVQRNLAVDGQVMEGGSVTLSAGALPAGVAVNLVAKPRLTQDLVFSDTGSRLRNLNEVADRATLRALRSAYDGVLEGAGEDILALAEAAGAAAAGEVAASKAERALSVAALANIASAQGVVVTPLGDFTWISGDQSANVGADPLKGIWVAPASAPSGSAGAWKRVYHGAIDPVWFGGRTSAALQAALNYAKAVAPGATIRPLGDYVMSATVRYEGGQAQGLVFDGAGAVFRRSGDYGRTFYISGTAAGEPLERCTWVFGRFEDANDSMTYANSRCHATFDNVNFLEWGVGEIVGGSSGVELLGCASTKPVGRQFWRMQGAYKGASSFAVRVGRSEIPASAHIYGGDHHGLGSLDVYCGRGRLNIVGSTSGASTTVTVNSTTGITVGGLIAGHGLNGADQYARIPKGTTVTGVNAGANTITLSTPVTLPANTPLAVFYPTLAYGVLIEACDGLWSDNEMVHSIFAGTASVAIVANAGNPVWNVRLRVMPDWAPGASFSLTGTGEVRDGSVEIHHPYNSKHSIVATATRVNFSILSQDQKWSQDGFDYGDAVSATQMKIEGAGGYSELLFKENGVIRYDLYSANGGMALQARNAAGVNLGNVWETDQDGKLLALKWPLQHTACSVAELSAAPFTGYYDGTEVLCYNCRVLTPGGALQAPGAGTGSKVWKLGGKWYVVGTNVEAQA